MDNAAIDLGQKATCIGWVAPLHVDTLRKAWQ